MLNVQLVPKESADTAGEPVPQGFGFIQLRGSCWAADPRSRQPLLASCSERRARTAALNAQATNGGFSAEEAHRIQHTERPGCGFVSRLCGARAAPADADRNYSGVGVVSASPDDMTICGMAPRGPRVDHVRRWPARCWLLVLPRFLFINMLSRATLPSAWT